jgi:hypothetical protein
VQRNCRRAPVETHHRFITKHRWEVDCERLHVRGLLRCYVHAKHIEAGTRIRLVKHVRSSAENDSPRRMLTRDEPERILARVEWFPLHQHVSAKCDTSRRISSRVPHGIPWDEGTKKSASARHGASIRNRDRRERDHLRHTAPLTERIALRLRGSGRERRQTCNGGVKPRGPHAWWLSIQISGLDRNVLRLPAISCKGVRPLLRYSRTIVRRG